MKMWVHVVVGLFLLTILIFGGILIRNLNADARELEFSNELAQQGQEVSTNEGCIACHTLDGSPGIGPTWLGMMGRSELLKNGNTIVVDEAYFRESISNPATKQVEGYPNVMLRYFLTEEETLALLEFARQLSSPDKF